MWLSFSKAWLLTLILPCTLFVLWVARRRPSKSIKGKLSLVLRCVLIVLLCMALAGAGVTGKSGKKAAWILVDASASMQDMQAEATDSVQRALSAAADGRQVGVIAFGKDAMVELPPGSANVYGGISTAIDASASDLSQALALASALLSDDADGGIAVISDGLTDDVDSGLLQSRGIAVNSYQLAAQERSDAQISAVEAPAAAYQGQSIAVTVTVDSTVAAQATLLLSANRSVIASKQVSLRKGENSFVFRDVASQIGVAAYEAQVVLSGDGVAKNDKAGAYCAVSGAPSVLLVEGQSGAGGEMKKLLTAAGMQVEVVSPAMLPHGAAELREKQAVALVNVDADSLDDSQITALGTAVKEFGVGLSVFGGDSSYALGNYRGSALEEMLPVTIDVKNKMELPSTALMIVIDKSGSMTDGQYGVSRLDVAKEAACRSLEVLTEQDQAGVIAFDEAGKWVVPLERIADVSEMQAQIGSIRAGGGTAFYTPLKMAYEALDGVQARHKHIIFLTDGESADTGYQDLVERMAEKNITLTTVAVGSGANVTDLSKLAELGGGRAYAAGEFDNVPKIFTKETMRIAGTYVQNRSFTPIVTDASLTDFSGFPTLDGYLAVTEKPLATVSLVSDREDPILAWWQYGAGRVLCWTSDVQGAWSQSFLAWEQATTFFGGLVVHVLPNYAQSGEMSLQDGTLRYIAEQGAENAQVTAQLLLPDGTLQSLTLEQLTPTIFEASVDTEQTGAYAVQIEMRVGGEVTAKLDGGAVVSYADEYDLRAEDRGVLVQLSADTGGKSVASPEELLSFPESAARSRHSLQTFLLCSTLILLLADIAQSRLNWERMLPKPASEQKEAPKEPKAAKARVKRQKAQPRQPAASEQLWQNLQKKQRM